MSLILLKDYFQEEVSVNLRAFSSINMILGAFRIAFANRATFLIFQGIFLPYE